MSERDKMCEAQKPLSPDERNNRLACGAIVAFKVSRGVERFKVAARFLHEELTAAIKAGPDFSITKARGFSALLQLLAEDPFNRECNLAERDALFASFKAVFIDFKNLYKKYEFRHNRVPVEKWDPFFKTLQALFLQIPLPSHR